jgi:hypothetical protein
MQSRTSLGHGAVSLSRSSIVSSFQPGVCQDIVWQLIIGAVSCAALSNKFALRNILGFGQFEIPTKWLYWFGTALGAIAIPISINAPIWAHKYGGRWSFLVGCSMPLIVVAVIVLSLVWREGNAVGTFWFTDAMTWLYCGFGGLMSMYLGEATEYPMTGYIWPSMWLLGIASTAAGTPRVTG